MRPLRRRLPAALLLPALLLCAPGPEAGAQAPYRYKRFYVNVAPGSDPRVCIQDYVRGKWDWRVKEMTRVASCTVVDRSGRVRAVDRYYVVARKKHTAFEP